MAPPRVRAGFAGCTRSCARVGRQKKSDSDSAADGPSKRPLRKRHAGENPATSPYRENRRQRRWVPAYAGTTIKS